MSRVIFRETAELIRANAVCWDVPTGGGQVRVRVQINCTPGHTGEVRFGSRRVEFASPEDFEETLLTEGMTLRIAAQMHDPGAYHGNRVTVTVELPNLTALAPAIHWGGEWVGFGYTTDDVLWTARGRPVHAALYYANDAGEVVTRDATGNPIGALAMRRIAEAPNQREESPWTEQIVSPLQVPMRTLPVPPRDATHLMTVVDPEEVIRESSKQDNRARVPLPIWPVRMQWVATPTKVLKSTTFAAANDSQTARQVRPVELKLRIEERIWRRWVGARTLFFLTVTVGVKAKGQTHRGWAFHPKFGPQLRSKRIAIRGGYVDNDVLYPMNGLNEAERPKGAKSSESKFLFIDSKAFDPATGEVKFFYLPPCTPGQDEIRVDLWRWDGTGRVLPKQSELPGAVTRGTRTPIASISTTLEIERKVRAQWKPRPESTVDASVFYHDRAPIAAQFMRSVKTVPLQLRILVNDRAAPAGYFVRFSITGPNGQLRGWILGEQAARDVKHRTTANGKLIRLPAKGDVIAPLIEPLTRRSVGGVPPNKKWYRYTVLKADGAALKCTFVAPEDEGDNTILAEVFDHKECKGEPLTKIRHTIRVTREHESIPIVFVPGIMGSALRRAGSDGSAARNAAGLPNLRWSPEVGWLLSNFLGRDPAERKAMLCDEPLEPNITSPEGDGVSAVFSGYADFLAWLARQEWPTLSSRFEFPVFACAYNWVDDGRHAGARIGSRVQQIIADERVRVGLCDRVILVTHSMGGLVGRAALKLSQAEASVLGVVHGVQPARGAPAAYWRMKAGFEGGPLDGISAWITSDVLGPDGPHTTAILANAVGALELLPNKRFRAPDGSGQWLTIVEADGSTTKLPRSASNPDPYDDIYRVAADVRAPAVGATAPSSWWGLVDPALLDPRIGAPPGLEREVLDQFDPWTIYAANISAAEAFHDELDEYAHRQTVSFRGVGLTTADRVRFALSSRPQANISPYETRGFSAPVRLPTGELYAAELQPKDGNGDGVVPPSSGALPEDRAFTDPSLPGTIVVDGMDHAAAFDVERAREFTRDAIVAFVKAEYVSRGAGPTSP